MLNLRSLRMSGRVQARVMRAPGPGLRWRLSNVLRWSYLRGWLAWHLAPLMARALGMMTAVGRLQAVLIRADGRRINYGTLSFRVITDTGVAFLVDCWQGTFEPEIMRYHGCGTGVGAEAVGNTALGTECTTALNPDNTRATGTLAEGASANIFSTVGTLTFDASAAVTEHGLLSQAATGGGVLWDRSLFSAINVVSGDSIQFTYQCTVSSGG